MTPTELGPLAFTAEDFDRFSYWEGPLTQTNIRDVANRILAEKLSKAPAVWTALDEDGDNVAADAWHEYYHVGYTHKARLVCIEEIKK